MVAVSVEARILEALLEHTVLLPGGRLLVMSNIVYPAAGQDKADEYIVVSFSPGTPQAILVDPADENKHMGIFGLSIMTLLNQGEYYSQEIGGEVASHFHGRVLSSGSTTVRVTARPRVAGGYVDGDRWRTPVTVPFETITV